ncbi:hypothetical protein ACP4OV_010298 [Aristida adscensionis]
MYSSGKYYPADFSSKKRTQLAQLPHFEFDVCNHPDLIMLQSLAVITKGIVQFLRHGRDAHKSCEDIDRSTRHTGQPEAEPQGRVPEPPPAGKGGLLRYNSPLAQVSLLGLIYFCCLGMFMALSGLGGGGQLDNTASDNANTAIYACFAVFGVLGSAAHNLLGPRLTLLLGALTYPLYAASFLYYNHRHSQGFPVAASGLSAPASSGPRRAPS